MRLRTLVLAVLVTVVAVLGFASTALAQDTNDIKFSYPDPQEANIPWVGWVGQTIKVAKCVPYNPHGDRTPSGVLDEASVSSINLELQASFAANGNFLIEDWSGLQTNWPQWTVGNDRLSVAPVQLTDRGLCWSRTIESEKPGLAKFKLSVQHELLVDIFLVLEGKGIEFAIGVEDLALYTDVVLEHQGLVIWLEEAGVTAMEISKDGPGLSAHVGDPLGDGKFVPPYDCSAYRNGQDATSDSAKALPLHENLFCVFGLVKINVKGSFPLGNNYSGLIAGDVVTLPDQWADLANALAADIDSRRSGDAAWRWDIHDDQATGDGLFGFHPFAGKAPFGGDLPDHHVDSICYGEGFGGTNLVTDAVDNCWGNRGQFPGDVGLFSTIYGGTYPTIGPFDPVRPDQTLLSNGVLDAGDAPMPSLPVEVSLDENSIGALYGVDKSDVYSVLGPHAGQGPPPAPNAGYDYPHNQYAPFYASLIPASGPGLPFRTGPYQAATNNFPGYIEDGVYEYWKHFEYTRRGGDNGCYDVLGNSVYKPTGVDKLEVYTDEHGEAWVKFYPYRGLFVGPDTNGLCDVYTTGGKPGVYGNATITAEPYYPGQTVATPAFQWGSASVDKTAYHLADKTLVCLPKGVNVAFCVETVTDYNGDPIYGVPVKFTTSGNAANMTPAAIKYNDDYNTIGQDVVYSDQDRSYVIKTNEYGQAGIEIVHSQDVCIDVTAENKATRNGGFGIQRFAEFNPHTQTACGGSTTPPAVQPPPPPSGGNGGSTGGGGTSSGGTAASTDSTVVSLGGPVITAKPVLTGGKTATIASSSARLFSVKVIQSQLGRFLIVNVKANKNALTKKKVLFTVKKRVALKRFGKIVKRNGKVVRVVKTVKVWKTVPAATVKIQILNKKGKVIKTVTRRVAVNKAFKIQNLKLPKAAASVRTSVIA